MTVTFCGHKDVFDGDGAVRAWLSKTVEGLD